MLALARDIKGKKKRVYIKSQEENQRRHGYVTQQERRATRTQKRLHSNKMKVKPSTARSCFGNRN